MNSDRFEGLSGERLAHELAGMKVARSSGIDSHPNPGLLSEFAAATASEDWPRTDQFKDVDEHVAECDECWHYYLHCRDFAAGEIAQQAASAPAAQEPPLIDTLRDQLRRLQESLASLSAAWLSPVIPRMSFVAVRGSAASEGERKLQSSETISVGAYEAQLTCTYEGSTMQIDVEFTNCEPEVECALYRGDSAASESGSVRPLERKPTQQGHVRFENLRISPYALAVWVPERVLIPVLALKMPVSEI